MGLLTKIYTTINNKILFDNKKEYPSVQEQEDYLNSFNNPRDEIEYSFFKYQCLMFYTYSKKQRALINFISFFAILLLFPVYSIRGIKYNGKCQTYQPKNILLRKATKRIPILDIFPDKLMDSYNEILDYEKALYSQIYITSCALKYLRKAIKAHPFNFHYNMVVLIRLSQACYLLNQYNPSCITTYVCEREFADPILTTFYEEKGVQYHGFMHGDYLYSLEHAFMHFTKYWLWAKHYENLFKSLRCDFATEIYIPGKYSGVVMPRKSVDQYDYYATYYFSDEKEESIEIIKRILMQLQNEGHRCKVRPHPRFSNVELIKTIFGSNIMVEDLSQMTIEASLECSYLTIALVSTVLSQAYYNGKKVVIDDVSNPKAYKELREKQYILIDKADMLLSELIN